MCLYLSSTCGDPNSPAALNAEMQTFILLRQHPFCPNSPTRTAPQAASPAQIALLIWQTQIPLPHPAPYIAPGYAITGKRAYLEIHDNPSLSPQHFNELGYDIAVGAPASGAFSVPAAGTTSLSGGADGTTPATAKATIFANQ